MNRLEQLEKTLKELSNEKWPVIVEGKRDKNALKLFGVTNVRIINVGPLQKLAATTPEEKIILITDYDRRGELLKESLHQLFTNEGIQTDLEYRKKLRSITGIMHVEDLPSKYEEMKQKYQR